MSARQVPILELIAPYTTERPAVAPVVGLTARLALLEHECREFRRDLNAAIENPFGDVRAEAAELEALYGPNFDWDQHFADTAERNQHAYDEVDEPVEAGEEQ
jgi:hypothetical protein